MIYFLLGGVYARTFHNQYGDIPYDLLAEKRGLTEILLQKGLMKLLENRTSFIIAHRLSTIQNADQILYIDQGGIMEQGNHEELLEKRGPYYNLYISQFDSIAIS